MTLIGGFMDWMDLLFIKPTEDFFMKSIFILSSSSCPPDRPTAAHDFGMSVLFFDLQRRWSKLEMHAEIAAWRNNYQSISFALVFLRLYRYLLQSHSKETLFPSSFKTGHFRDSKFLLFCCWSRELFPSLLLFEAQREFRRVFGGGEKTDSETLTLLGPPTLFFFDVGNTRPALQVDGCSVFVNGKSKWPTAELLKLRAARLVFAIPWELKLLRVAEEKCKWDVGTSSSSKLMNCIRATNARMTTNNDSGMV